MDGFTPPTPEMVAEGDYGDLTDCLVPVDAGEEITAALEAGELSWDEAWHRLAEASAEALAGVGEGEDADVLAETPPPPHEDPPPGEHTPTPEDPPPGEDPRPEENPPPGDRPPEE